MILLLLILPGIMGITIPMKQYFTVQKDLVIVDHNLGFMKLIIEKSTWPLFINYTQNITSMTGIEITVGFAERNESHELDHIIINRMDICDILINSVGMPHSPQSKFMIPEMLGLFGTECPIRAGLRNISPYRFPTILEMEDIGTGEKEFIIKIDDKNKSGSIITLITSLDMKYWDAQKLSVNSSSTTLTPSIIAFIGVVVIKNFII